MKRTADVVIIGGGVTGCSIAFHLAEGGVRDVVILERRFLVAGGTGRSVRIMRQLYPTPETSQMVLHSLRVFLATIDDPRVVQRFRARLGLPTDPLRPNPAPGPRLGTPLTGSLTCPSDFHSRP